VTKKLVCVLLALLMTITLCGCNLISGEAEAILKAPKPGGQLNAIQEALKREVSSDYTLKYAKSGELRSAFLLENLRGDERQEAVVFYSLKKNKTESLNISVFSSDEKDWRLIGSAAIGGTDIEKVQMGDVNGDKIPELVVGWSIYGAPEKRLTVFDLKGDIPLSVYEDSHFDYHLADLTKDKTQELIICTRDTVSETVKFSMLEYENKGMKVVSSCEADKKLTAIRRFNETEVDSFPALFVDAFSGSEYYTEILYFDGTALRAPLFEQSAQTGTLTARYSDISCGDVDDKKALEIPCQTALPGEDSKETKLYLTEWKSYSRGQLSVVERSVISKAGQYRVIIDEAWLGKFTALSSQENDTCIFYEYSPSVGVGKELFRISLIDKGESTDSEYSEWFQLYEEDSTVALAKIAAKSRKIDISKVIIENAFRKTITEGK